MQDRLVRSVARWTAVLAAAFWAAGLAAADTVTLNASKDASIYGDNNDAANGQGDIIHVGRNAGGSVRRGLITFDVSSIPSGSTVTAVTLTLRVDAGGNSGPSNSVGVHRVTQSWTEGPGDGGSSGGNGVSAQTNDVTWQHRTYSSLQWSTLGGTFVAGASATTAVTSSAGPRTWTGAGLVADVQAWVDGTANNGWMLKGNETTNQTARRFASRSHPTPSQRPTLQVTFTPPVNTGACCVSDGACQVYTSAVCAIASGSYQGNGTSCTPNPCPQPMGACCVTGGTCISQSPTVCATNSGTYQGNGTVCSPNPCQLILGGCCLPNATCSVMSFSACKALNFTTYQGYNTTCTGVACNWVLTPFMDPLPIPAVATPTTGTAGGAAHYDIAMTQFTQQLHSQLPPTTVWGYAGTYPGPTIEARKDQLVTVTWINDLRDFPGGPHRVRHLLPVDTCLHGPNVTGFVPYTVVHLHGAHAPADSDGDPEATFPPGQLSSLYTYPNHQQAATLWYHDHALGITRLNVYMGLAGFYLLRDDAEDALNLPRGEFEIPLVIQDRSFKPDGELKFNQTFSDQFFGDFILVNGKVWPYLDVKQGKYRFRLLNGSNTRTYTLGLSGADPTGRMWQIGSDLGLLAAPVPITQITIMPGERADIVIDFAGISPTGRPVTLVNTAPVPFPGGGGGPAISNVMQFQFPNLTPGHTAALPATQVPVPRTPESQSVLSRSFELAKVNDLTCGHDMWLINALMWNDITEFPVMGTTEIWSWVNRSGIAHPMHMHLVQFQVLDRQDFIVDGMNNVVPVGSPVLPGPGELGWKDTVQAAPNQITRVIAKFDDYAGRFPYHCHILDHEDHEMMRQFQVVCAPIVFTLNPVSVTVRRGQSVTLTAEATGSSPLAYQWRRTDPDLSYVDGPTGNGSTAAGSTTPALTLSNIQLADAGRHACRVTDPCGNERYSNSAIITVLCAGDFNLSGTVSVQDIFDFLAAYFGNQMSADVNNSGTVSVQDIFDFLAMYFGPC